MDQLNRLGTELVDEAIDFADELGIAEYRLDNETTVLDFGVEHAGGVEAGLMLTEIQTAGLASVTTRLESVGDAALPHVEVTTDHPALALLAGQKAGWELATEDFEGLGSGPARALVAREEIFERLEYVEAFDFAVLAVESDALPTEAAAAQVADLAGVPESSVFLPAFSTASITGSVAAGARASESAVFQLFELGYDPEDVHSVSGVAPVAPVAESEEAAIARTNDVLAYGGRVHLTVESEFDRFEEIPSTAGEEYSQPFAEIFEDADWDFEELPAEVFGPAQVTVDVIGGETAVYGETDEALLVESFGL
ncbi:methenyltetrahydromethanopterin cyclohydrolase [Halorhabdus sp. BNX81]|uniref:methenyltetrahydromethanopterin cyclohydrolase n=1 Tax=Halorhabdus sp. BNX81 TaxID=2980181 RepID=UPI0023DD2B5B|nr:methenyltetrahydromethanopterin cyclohydrolase [Halorhabdus sp. BNX81]WEL20523.1 Methenyltetrahydromethanopterin cyclohydrolase [Halorhabdus sp. BNX81]